MANNKGSLKSTLAVSLNNYLDAGAIVAGASGLTLWQNYLGLSELHLGWLNFISANCLGAAIGAIIGGFLADKYGRKFIFTYNLLVYMLGVLLIMCSVNFPMLLAGFLLTGISVGVGVPASWTYISESSEVNNRGRNICISQMSWGIGPMCILLLGMLFAPGGYLFDWVQSLAVALSGTDANADTINVFSSRIVFFSLFVVAFIAWNLQRGLQESAEFTAQKAEGKQAGLIDNIKVLFRNKVAVKTVAFLAVIYLTWNLVASVMGFFQPHIYESAGGMSNKDANMLSCISWAVVVAVTFLISYLVDKVAHRIFYVFGLLCALSAWFIIVGIGVSNLVWLWVFTILWGINNGCSVQVFYALWGSELFPAKFRAGAQGLMFFIVRGLSAVWGLVFTYIYGENGEGFTLAAYCMVGLLLISLIVGVIGAPNTRGKSLDVITKERYGDNLVINKISESMASILDGRPGLKAVVDQIAEVTGYLWQKGWAERNGGNITVNVTEFMADECKAMKAIAPVKQIGMVLPQLKGKYFYCKGTGKRMRDLARWPMQNGSIVRICDDCASYEIIADEPVVPTSELPTHLALQNYLLETGSCYKATLHTHPIELVAMSHIQRFLKGDEMTRVLWSMIPETLAFAPLGIGIVPYALPSSVELAEATLEQVKTHDVVLWEKHGTVAVGTDIMDAFDQTDVLCKAANIYMCARNMGSEPDGMTAEAMKEVQDVFNLPKKRPC